ncbi:hypothetical protein Btru_016256 [Bulinus truncatus]|nr:hypothetical protein Btru_016256 [Bulinus truncatus]
MKACNKYCEQLTSCTEVKGVRNLLKKDAHGFHLQPSVWFSMFSCESRLSLIRSALKQGFDPSIQTPNGDSALHVASRLNLISLVRELVKHGSDINSQNRKGSSPLLLASKYGHFRTAQFLIKRNADVLISDKKERTPLMLASRQGDVNTVKLLLENKSPVDFCGKEGTALHYAAWRRHVKIAQLLISFNINVNKKTQRGWTALNIASDTGCYEMSIVLLSLPKVKINRANDAGRTPLMTAAFRGYATTVDILLRRNADPQLADKEGNTALMLACVCGSLDIFKKLQKVSDLHKLNNNGENALILAAQSGSLEITELLFKNSADLNIVNNEGNNALMLAANLGHAKIVKLLLEKNFQNVNSVNTAGWSALMLSCKVPSVCTKLLLDRNSNVHSTSTNGLTALLIASEYGNVNAVQILIKKTSKIDQADSMGETALMKAAKRGHLNVVRILIKKKADISLKNQQGNTALMLAVKKSFVEIVEFLLKNSADVCSTNGKGFSSLMVGAEYGNSKTVEILLKHNANAHYKNEQGMSALSVACLAGNLDAIEPLLRKKANVNTKTVDGRTPIMLAASKGHAAVVELLLEKHANANEINSDGCTALHIASQSMDQPHLLETLLQSVSDVDQTNNDGYTALFLAAEKGHMGNLKELLKHGSNFDVSNTKTCPLTFATRRGHTTCVELLLFIKSMLDTPTYNKLINIAAMHGHRSVLELLLKYAGNTESFISIALNIASKYQQVKTLKHLTDNHSVSVNSMNDALKIACIDNRASSAKTLCRLGAQVDFVDKNGSTPLILAAARGNTEVVRVLIENHCDVNNIARIKRVNVSSSVKLGNSQPDNGALVTALHVAAQCGHEKCTEELLKAGANVNALDQDGYTPLTLARMNDHPSIAALLVKYNAVEADMTCNETKGVRSSTTIIIQSLQNLSVSQVDNMDVQNALNLACDNSVIFNATSLSSSLVSSNSSTTSVKKLKAI